MASTELEILLKADVDQATKAIERFAKQVGVEIKEGISIYDAFDAKIKEVEASLKKASDPKDVARLTKELKSLQATFSTIKSDRLFQAGEGIGKAGKAAANATPALTNFGRVIQDAPFGIIGIANNIDPLVSSFQSLSKQAGGTGGALKALFSSLAGPAGIAIAVSTVTSALIAFGPQIKDFFTGSGKAAESAKKAQEAINALAEGVAKDLVNFQTLVAFSADATKSYEDRAKAIKALRDEYPAYLKNVSDEALLTGQAADATSRFTDSLLKQAVIKTLKDDIAALVAERAKDIIAIEKQRIENEKLTRNAQKRAEGFAKATDSFNENALKAAQSGRVVGETFIDIGQKADVAFANRPDEKIRLIKEELAASVQDIIKVADSFDDLGIKLKTTTDGKVNSDDRLAFSTNRLTGLYEVQKNELLLLNDAINKLRNSQEQKNIADKAAALIAATANTQQAPAALGKLKIPIAISDKDLERLNLTKEEIAKLAEATKDTNAAFGLLGPAIDQAFNALANGENAAQAVGQAIKQLIVQLVKAVIQAAILAAILNAINPVGAATRGGFSGILGSLLGFRAAGGPVSAGSPYVVGESGPELFVPGTSGQVVPNMALTGAGSLVARVSGSDLLFILNNAQRSRGSVFG